MNKFISFIMGVAVVASTAPFAFADTVFEIDFPRVGISTQASAPISGSCDSEDGSISVSIIDESSASVGPQNTTCVGGIWSLNFDVTSLSDGELTAEITAGEDTPLSEVAQKDTAAAVIDVFVGDGMFATLAQGFTFGTDSPTFEFSSNDNVETLECSLDGGASADCIDFIYNATDLSDGPHTLTLSSVDDFDNVGSTVVDFCVNTCEESGGGGDEETVGIRFEVHTESSVLFADDIEVSECASDEAGTTMSINGLCAFDEAELDRTLTWFGASAFVDTIEGMAGSDGDDEDTFADDFWLWFLNGGTTFTAINQYELQDGDTIVWTLGKMPLQISVSTSSPEVGDTTSITVLAFDAINFAFEDPVEGASIVGTDLITGADGTVVLTATSTDALTISAIADGYITSNSITLTPFLAVEEEEETLSGGGGGGPTHLTFNVPAALAFLSGKQNADGSFANAILTDWAALAFSAADPGSAKTLLRTYLSTNAPSLTNVQDNIRHAMALMALGINPYSGTSVDYIAPIVSSFDGTQIGSASLSNDDIFALFPLSRAGYSSADLIIQKTVAFIVANQNDDGSWTGGVDMTAAAVQALSQYTSEAGVPAALTKAESYLHSQQQTNGGFSNASATSWAMQAIAALGQNETMWTAGGLYPRDYLAGQQQSDGGVELLTTSEQTRVWATEYAIPGATGKTWYTLLSSFARPSPYGTGGSATTATSTIETTGATTAPPIATSTPSVATTTREVLGAIIASVSEEVPEEAFVTRLAEVSESAQDAPETPEVEPTTEDAALQQIAAAAQVPGVNWTLVVLAFLALILFGIAGYVAFVRKYWR